MHEKQQKSRLSNHLEEKSINELSELTIDFFAVHNILPTPINYSVFYLYHSNENTNLNQKINNKIDNEQVIDSIFIDDLFHQYVANTKKIDNELYLPFENVLTNTLQQIDHQVNNEQEVVTNLSKISTAIEKLDKFKPIQNIINFLVSLITQSKDQRASLSKELQRTSAEVSSLKSKLETSRKDALIDALTGLYNRRGCEERLSELKITDTHSSIVIDIDHFKNINDTFGHSIGDKVIQLIAKIIKKIASDNNISVRYGGEEFVVILVNQSKTIAESIAEKIRLAVTTLKLVQKNTKIQLPPISVSIGIAELNNDHSWDDLFSRADKALYQAKNSGRNCCITAK